MIDNSIMPEVTIADKVKLYLYIGKLLLSRKKRDHSKINEEYNSGIWNRKFDDVEFESLSSNYGRKDNEEYSIFTTNGKLFKGIRSEYEKKYLEQIFDVLDNHINDSVVEFGCGLGANLFQLYNRKFKKLEGYDISENAVSLATQYCKKKEYDIHFGVCDMTKSLPIIKDKVIFTRACLEQLKHTMPNVLKNIITGKPKLVINFEVDYNTAPPW
jgi:SAM-dependent methyltransferase